MKNSMTVSEPAIETQTTGPGRTLFGIPLKKGGVVPGKGNRDTVKARLTPGELVIPKKSAPKVRKMLQGKAGAYAPLKPKKGPSGLMEG